jgi:2-amino-4-hydroxy-6-hydroxymethyldihydropteridine diphosphokinase
LSGPSEAGTVAWLGLGGNIGDPSAAMAAALRALDADPRVEILAVSSLYRTPPWGVTDQPDFLNAVASVRTELGARELLDLCLDIEKSLKRVREMRWGPRLIDIDVLVFGEARIDEEGLHVPHPRMLERAFVMLPLAEIAPELELKGRPARDWARDLDVTGIETLPGGRGWWRKD